MAVARILLAIMVLAATPATAAFGLGGAATMADVPSCSEHDWDCAEARHVEPGLPGSPEAKAAQNDQTHPDEVVYHSVLMQTQVQAEASREHVLLEED